MKQIIITLAICLSLFSCDDEQTAGNNNGNTTTNTSIEGQWTLQMIVPANMMTPTLDFADSKILGNSFCNTMFGEYHTDNEKLSIPSFGGTKIGCSDGDMESKFWEAMQTAKSYKISNNILTIYNNSTDSKWQKLEFTKAIKSIKCL